METCDFCGHEGQDVTIEDYYDPIIQHDTVKWGCKDKGACFTRQCQRAHKFIEGREDELNGLCT